MNHNTHFVLDINFVSKKSFHSIILFLYFGRFLRVFRGFMDFWVYLPPLTDFFDCSNNFTVFFSPKITTKHSKISSKEIKITFSTDFGYFSIIATKSFSISVLDTRLSSISSIIHYFGMFVKQL